MLTILNINRFKLFNQGKGHVIGDQVLIEFARKLKEGVGAKTEVMRLGGDEFGLVSINLREIDALNANIDAICKEPILVGERDFFINVAIGQAIYPLNALNADGLLRAANAAMHQAKQIPGTSLVLAEARFEESLTRAMEQEQALKSAILNREICLYYQPKVDARTHRLVGFEALARWIRPGVGIVSPVEFIAVAEKTALISELGTMLLSDACSQIAAWTAEYGNCVPVAEREFCPDDRRIDPNTCNPGPSADAGDYRECRNQ
jgi:diguanylate cyclase (GGDEF)-like protein